MIELRDGKVAEMLIIILNKKQTFKCPTGSRIGETCETRDEREREREVKMTPSILMRRTNAGYRLLSRKKSWRINAITRGNKERTNVIAESVVRSARLLGKSAFKPTGWPKRAKAEASGAGARAQDECNYARCGARKRGRVRVYNFL